MLKLVGALLLTGGGLYAGLGAAGELAGRVKDLDAWADALTLLQSELSFRLPAMPELVEILSQRGRGSAREVFVRLGEELDKLGERSFEELWSAALAGQAGGLRGEDLDALLPLGGLLGRYGWEDQCLGLQRVREQLSRHAGQAREDLRRKGKAYGTLGVALGAFLSILLL